MAGFRRTLAFLAGILLSAVAWSDPLEPSDRIDFSEFPTARFAPGSAAVTWSTSQEVGVVGFDIRESPKASASDEEGHVLIPATNSLSGGAYSFPVSSEAVSGPWLGVLRCWMVDGRFLDVPIGTGAPRPVALDPGGVTGSGGPPRVAPRAAALAAADGGDAPGEVVAVDVFTADEGVHFVGPADLAPEFGISDEAFMARAASEGISFRQGGEEIPVWYSEEEAGWYFNADRIDSLVFSGNVTQVRLGTHGIAIGTEPAADVAAGSDYAEGRARIERNLQAVLTLPGLPDDDFWVGDTFLGGHPSFGARNYTVTLPGFADVAEAGGVLEVEVVTASDVPHSFQVLLNGQELGRANWEGRRRQVLRFPVDPGSMSGEVDVVRIVSAGDRLSLGYLDRISVGYPRRLQPTGGPVVVTAVDDVALEASVPTGSDVEVWDVESPRQPVRIARAMPGSAGERLVFQGRAGHRYVAFRRGEAFRPTRFRGKGPGSLRDDFGGASYVVVAPDALLPAARLLAARRAGQGMTTRVVSIGEIQHEFGFGVPDPDALVEFVGHAFGHWPEPPRYLLLLGDGTYDYRDHMGVGDNLIPPLLVSTLFGRAVTDFGFGDPDGDGRPDVAVGRLPARTEEEALRMLEQVADYESAVVPRPGALIVADRPDDGGAFLANAAELAAILASRFQVGSILNDSLELDEVRSRLAAGLAAGVDVFVYVGHGGRDRFGSGYVTIPDVGGLDFGSRQPIIVAMTCTAGQFGLPGAPCLGEALLLKEGRAPVAVWSGSGFSIDHQAHPMNLLLAEEMANGASQDRLGDMLRRVVRRHRDGQGDLVTPQLYNLLGDPGLRTGFQASELEVLLVRTEAGFLLRVVGVPGGTYSVQSTGSIVGEEWTDLASLVLGDSGSAELPVVPADSDSALFFRLVQE